MPRLRPTFFALCVTALACVGIGWVAACSSTDDDADNGDPTNQSTNDANTDNQSDNDDPPVVCGPGQSRCDGPERVETCNDEGTGWQTEDCPEDQRCEAGSATCTDQVCQPGQFEECTDDGDHRHCNASGTDFVDGDCPEDSQCTDGTCSITECDPGVERCGAAGVVETCSEAGVWVPSHHCSSGAGCFDGQCEELCEISSKSATYIGCEYWSIDLDNYREALAEPHAIIITNPNDELAADIQLFEGASDTQIINDFEGNPLESTVPPGEARIYQISAQYTHSGTSKFDDRAIRINSDIPVVAHQFNPLNHVEVYSNDGSLLLPTDTVGTEYWVKSWYNRDDAVQLLGYVTMVNSSDQPTEVTVRPSAQIVAGSDIPTIEAGDEHTFELDPGQSLNLASSGTELTDAESEGCLADPEGSPDSVDPCPDLTGTHIESDHPITVFGGHQCANVLLGVDRCDHVESLLPPVDTWGHEYVGTKFEPRTDEGATAEPDIWRVIAAEDDTSIQTDPPIDGVHGAVLEAGDWKQFAVREDFEIVGDGPILATQYMVGANWSGIPRVCDEGRDAWDPTGIGDPAMAVAVATGQFREDYIVHTPDNYDENYLNVIVPVGVDVQLDGETIPADRWEIVGQMDRFEVATVEVDAGFHTLEADTPFGVVGYGYACHVSYAYPGGTDLEPLADEVPIP